MTVLLLPEVVSHFRETFLKLVGTSAQQKVSLVMSGPCVHPAQSSTWHTVGTEYVFIG